MNRDQKKRHLVWKFEVTRTLYKSIASSMALSHHVRAEYARKLAALPRNSSPTRIVNRCIQSGRPKAVYKQFRLSRICFRNAAVRGLLPGVYKSSW